MIHIATVHWQTDKWIDIQLNYLKKHIKEDFQVYAFLEGMAVKHASKFHFVIQETIHGVGHAEKLNILAEIIYFSSNDPDDIIIFIDGDAFPVGNVMKLILEKIEKHKIIAIQRLENDEDPQPHPSFCATTLKFWKEIKGDWKKGYKWWNKTAYITDVGGNLLGILNRLNINWYTMHRTTQLHDHPLWFGVYDGVIYHHGSGFRTGASRVVGQMEGIERKRKNILSIILDKVPDDLITSIKYKIHPVKRFKRRVFKNYEGAHNEIYRKIRKDEINFFEQ